MPDNTAFQIDNWCGGDLASHREILARTIAASLEDCDGLREVTIAVGPRGREYDLVAIATTDVGAIRTPLWSHARATMFCDESVHPANREQVSPHIAVEEAVQRLQSRLAVVYKLESRGLTFDIDLEPGVTRSWTAEHSRFRKRTAVTREDVVDGGSDVDVRDLLAHFYTGPSIRLVSEDGDPFLLPGKSDVEGPQVTLCRSCRHWSEGDHSTCPDCGSDAVDRVTAARHPER